MQISAANLIVAAQQTRTTASPAKSAPPAAPEKSAENNGFEPIAFKTMAASAEAAQPAKQPQPAEPMGSQLDIKV